MNTRGSTTDSVNHRLQARIKRPAIGIFVAIGLALVLIGCAPSVASLFQPSIAGQSLAGVCNPALLSADQATPTPETISGSENGAAPEIVECWTKTPTRTRLPTRTRTPTTTPTSTPTATPTPVPDVFLPIVQKMPPLLDQ